MLCLLGDQNKCPVQDVPLCNWWISFSRPSSMPMVLTGALSPRRPDQMCRGFPVSVVNALYKIIFWVSLLYWLDELCLPGHLNNECAEASPVSLIHSLFKAIFSLKLLYWLEALTNQRTQQWMLRAEDSQVSVRHGLFKNILSLKLQYWLKALVSQENDSNLCLPKTSTINMQRWVFPKS